MLWKYICYTSMSSTVGRKRVTMIDTPMTECTHTFVRAGLWDGKSQETGEEIGGPSFRCDSCGKTVRVQWGEELKRFVEEYHPAG